MDDKQLNNLIESYYEMYTQPTEEQLDEGISFEVGSGDPNKARRQQKINKAADAGVPNAARKASGAVLPTMKLANSYEEEGEQIDEVLGGQAGDGYIGHPRLGIKNPLAKKQTSTKTSSNTGIAGKLGNRASQMDAAMKQLRNSYEPEDAYDIVLEYLMAEGYATTVENADQIMAVMAEGKIKEIVEAKSKDDPCWKNYTQVGMKMKGGKEVPNCVPSKGVEKAKGYKK